MIALVALVGVTAVWGYTFLVVQDAIARMAVMDFLAWRFVVASVVMIALRPTCLRNVTRLELLRGVTGGTIKPYTPNKANTTIAATVAMSSSLPGRDDQKDRLSLTI